MTRLSTQELDDVLAAHNRLIRLCGGCGEFWPCLTYRLARDLKAALKVVEAARGFLEYADVGSSVYGGFMGGDPRRFTPDDESCTSEEIAAHATACEEWDAGEGIDRGPSCSFAGDGSVHDGTGFGVGVTTFEEPEKDELIRALAAYDNQENTDGS